MKNAEKFSSSAQVTSRVPKGPAWRICSEFGFPSPGNVQVCNPQPSEPFLTSLLSHGLQLFGIYLNRSHRAASLPMCAGVFEPCEHFQNHHGSCWPLRQEKGLLRGLENEKGRGTRTIPGKKAPRVTAGWDTTPPCISQVWASSCCKAKST